MNDKGTVQQYDIEEVSRAVYADKEFYERELVDNRDLFWADIRDIKNPKDGRPEG